MPRSLSLIILCAVLASTGAAIYHFRTELKGGAQEQLRQTLKQKSGGDCWYANVCGDLAYYDCGADTDGPTYFVDTARKLTVGECGSLCHGANAGRCPSECPPPAWNCPLNEIAPENLRRLYSLNEGLAEERSLRKVLRPFDAPYPREGAGTAARPDPAPPSQAIFAAPAKGAGAVDEDGNPIAPDAEP